MMRLPSEAPPTSLFASVVVPSRAALAVVRCNQINGLDRVRVPKMDLPSAISVLSTGRIALPRSLDASPVRSTTRARRARARTHTPRPHLQPERLKFTHARVLWRRMTRAFPITAY